MNNTKIWNKLWFAFRNQIYFCPIQNCQNLLIIFFHCDVIIWVCLSFFFADFLFRSLVSNFCKIPFFVTEWTKLSGLRPTCDAMQVVFMLKYHRKIWWNECSFKFKISCDCLNLHHKHPQQWDNYVLRYGHPSLLDIACTQSTVDYSKWRIFQPSYLKKKWRN